MPLQKKNRLRSVKNEIFSLLCILVDRPMGGIEPPTPPAYALAHAACCWKALYGQSNLEQIKATCSSIGVEMSLL